MKLTPLNPIKCEQENQNEERGNQVPKKSIETCPFNTLEVTSLSEPKQQHIQLFFWLRI